MTTNSREMQLHELEEFIEKSKKKLDAILQQLQWTNELTLGTRKEKQMSSGLPESTWPVARHSVSLDAEKLSNVIGERMKSESSLASDLLSPDQKLAVYSYCIQKTGRLTEPEMSIMIYPDDGGSKKEMTFAEIVAEKRNAKRRTVRYRTGVTQSYLSEVRNLIELQMSALSQYANDAKNVKRSYKFKGNSDREFCSWHSKSTSSSRYENNGHNQGTKSSTSSSEWRHDKKDKLKYSKSHRR